MNRLQALSGLGDFAGADAQAAALDRLAETRERPGVTVFTGWYWAMRATTGDDDGYQRVSALLDQSGMPGVAQGLLPLALLCLRVWCHQSAGFPPGTDWALPGHWALP